MRFMLNKILRRTTYLHYTHLGKQVFFLAKQTKLYFYLQQVCLEPEISLYWFSFNLLVKINTELHTRNFVQGFYLTRIKRVDEVESSTDNKFVLVTSLTKSTPN